LVAITLAPTFDETITLVLCECASTMDTIRRCWTDTESIFTFHLGGNWGIAAPHNQNSFKNDKEHSNFIGRRKRKIEVGFWTP